VAHLGAAAFVGGLFSVPDEVGIERSAAMLSDAALYDPLEGKRASFVGSRTPIDETALSDSPYHRWVKQAFDVACASSLLVLFAPVMIVAACLIWVFDGWPIFFVQPLVGHSGKVFSLIKFRTMVHDAEAVLDRWQRDNPELWRKYVDNNFKISDDPRLIGCGRLLRRYSIDELPQLWNVLRGDMSLVGPRPLLASELPAYCGNVGQYGSVRPGITGLWQVSGRSHTSFADRAALDREYVQDVSFAGDFRLLLQTLPIVISGKGAF
jgi:lipopolysaccharide/colanic/teichoic acid biosynthesis glycosyltransferase